MTVAIEIDNVDVTASVIWNTLLVQKSAEQLNSVAGFQIRNVAVVSGQDVYIYDDTWDIFRGTVATCQVATQTTTETILDVTCVDLNDMLDKRVCDTAITSIVNSDADFIDWLFTEYLPSVDSETYVKELELDLTGMALEPNTLRAIMNQVCALTGAYYYIDAQARLHYFDSEAEAAPFGLSDEPDNFTTFSYLDDPVKVEDGSRTLAGVFVVGSGIKGWRGSHGTTDPQAIVYDKKVSSLGALEKRGDKVLNVYGAAKVSYDVRTLEPGLEVGQDIPFKCDLYSVNDTFTIRKMDVTWEDGFVVYSLTLGDPVNPAVEGGRTWQEIIPQALGPVYPPQLPTSSLGWAHDLVFSATDHNTVAWTAGTITLADGTSYSIDAGNTGNMAAATYIYLDLDTSTTALQKVTVSSTAVGSNKVLVAVAYPSAVGYDATYMVFGQPGNQLVDTENILAGAVDTDQLAALAVTGAKIEALTIVGGHIAAATITGAKIAAATIEGGHIKANTITAANIAAATITTNEIAANTIVAGNIAAGAIGTDELAAGSVTATKITNTQAIPLFTSTGGLALWGPNGAMTTTSWTSTRGQQAAITGAFRTGPGAWANTRALQVAPYTVNKVLNPNLGGTYSSGIAPSWSKGGTAASLTCTESTAYKVFGEKCQKLEFAPGATNPYFYTTPDSMAYNTEYTWQLWLYVESFDTGVRVRFGKGDGYNDHNITTTGMHYVTTTATTAASGSLFFTLVSALGGNAVVYLLGAQCEGKPDATPLAAGDMGSGYSFTGTPYESTTIRQATNLSAGRGAFSPTAGTIAIRCKQHAKRTTNSYLCRPGDGSAMDIFQASANGSIAFRIGGITRCSIPGGDWNAGEELDLIFTYDVAGNESKAYLNGELKATGTCPSFTPGTSFQIGGLGSGDYQWNGWISQFGVFSKVLSAEDVAAMHNLGKPLVDTGAVDVPGIYLYDGRFRLASRATGARTEIDVDGIKAYSASAQSVAIETDGDAKFGSNIGTAAGTALAVFATAQTYNSEGMGAGDVLLGDNSASKANMKWDASEGKLLFRGGTTMQAYVGTDGQIVCGGGNTALGANGMRILTTTAYHATRAVTFLTGSTDMAKLQSYRNSGTVHVLNLTTVGVGTNEDSNILIDAWAESGNNSAQVALRAYDGQGGSPAVILDSFYNNTWQFDVTASGVSKFKVNQAAITCGLPFVLPVYSSDPGSPVNGMVYVKTDGTLQYYYSGWHTVTIY